MNSQVPLISVILPVYNAENTVLEAVHSVLKGTFESLELVVIDDGSTDRSVEILKSIKDPRMVLVQNKHQGIVATANMAASMTRADWIARMDADDISHPRRLEEQWKFANQTGCNVVSGLVRITDLEGNPVASMQRYSDWLNSLTRHDEIVANRFVELPLVNPSILARREFFLNRCGQGDYPEDYDQWLQAIAEGAKVGKTDSIILDWRDHPHRLTRTDKRYEQEAFDRCKQHYLLKGPLEDVEKVILWGVGQRGKPWLRWLLRNSIDVPCAVDVSPRKTGMKIHGVEVIAPDQLQEHHNAEIPIVAAVGAAGAREEIASFLQGLGYVAGMNLWFVA